MVKILSVVIAVGTISDMMIASYKAEGGRDRKQNRQVPIVGHVGVNVPYVNVGVTIDAVVKRNGLPSCRDRRRDF